MMHRVFPCLAAWGAAVAFASGCRGGDDQWIAKRPKVATAAGVVTFKGAPVEGATVIFAPTTGQDAASGITDSSGRFSVSAFPPDAGAVPGQYKVGVTKREHVAPSTSSGHDEAAAESVPKSLLPERYSEPETSGLTADIPAEGKKNLTFDLAE